MPSQNACFCVSLDCENVFFYNRQLAVDIPSQARMELFEMKGAHVLQVDRFPVREVS